MNPNAIASVAANLSPSRLKWPGKMFLVRIVGANPFTHSPEPLPPRQP
jgi:hypothetical protein